MAASCAFKVQGFKELKRALSPEGQLDNDKTGPRRSPLVQPRRRRTLRNSGRSGARPDGLKRCCEPASLLAMVLSAEGRLSP